ncbi:MAG: DUF1345 domain-containing protein [Myxococcales bacterium]|nr:DUF1345 domain-containing protein [Myxococcales bacterium]
MACVAAVVLAWLLTHVSYALRYAHLYYRDDDEGIGGLAFPGGEAARHNTDWRSLTLVFAQIG